ncbi:MAG: recombinase family protein [Pirellulaceae bacterium]
MKRNERGRALFYTRDSGGKAETTPAEYVAWAIRKSEELGTSFDGTARAIEGMIRAGTSVCGDIFLDYDICGNLLSRPGLDAMIKETKNDAAVSHVFIPRRDRLARPDEPIDALQIENSLRRDGLTLVFMDKTVGPRSRGQRPDIADQIVAMIDYNSAGQFRRDLAQKILYAQLSLAKNGYSTGGRPPFGFRRWLVREDGTQVRQLADGERVRISGHHVVWLPGPAEELHLIRRILRMLKDQAASQVARILTGEGIPSPGAGKYRTDNGIQHLVSGVWHSPTIRYIATNPLLVAVTTYGRRSMGDQLRFTDTGPRDLTDEDFRADHKPKVVNNGEAAHITAPARFEPIVDEAAHSQLLTELERRSGSQRGVPKSQKPDENPLGCRVFDLNCGWTMYREPYSNGYRYKCGLYQQSHGGACTHNHVDGPLATKFVLSCIQQWILTPGMLGKVKDHLDRLAKQQSPVQTGAGDSGRKVLELERVNADLEKVSRNMALAEGPEQFGAISAVFN